MQWNQEAKRTLNRIFWLTGVIAIMFVIIISLVLEVIEHFKEQALSETRMVVSLIVIAGLLYGIYALWQKTGTMRQSLKQMLIREQDESEKKNEKQGI